MKKFLYICATAFIYTLLSCDANAGSSNNILSKSDLITTNKNDSIICQKVVWKFSVIVGVNQLESSCYGGFDSIKIRIINQFDEVNHHFNDPGVFNGVFNFSIDSIYEFQGNSQSEVHSPPSGFAYRVIVDGVSAGTGGGWYGYPTNTIMHNWSNTSFGGTFGSYGTDALTHEFGHSRGAVDLYALQVLADSNKVNGQAFQSDTSIMNYSYGISVWDTHSVNIINLNTDIVLTNALYITSKFPDSIGIITTKGTNNVPINNVKLEVFPVKWYTYKVLNNPLLIAFTDTSGKFNFISNPFSPNTPGFAWNIVYCNFLIRAVYDNDTIYKWMPLNEVQNSYFADPSLPYFLSIVFPFNASVGDLDNTNNILFEQNYPNPFNSSTTIEFTLTDNANTTLNVYDITGREVATLLNHQLLSAGSHKVLWNAGSVKNGIYECVLTVGNSVQSHKMIINK